MYVRIVNEDISLVPYYPNDEETLQWYQDPELCKQVDNRDTVYDLNLLRSMYRYLDEHGRLFYVAYQNKLCGDVCLQENGEINIVIAKTCQNRHIGRAVIGEIIRLARELGYSEVYANIYAFNLQSQKMFESCGFQKTTGETYTLKL